MQTPQCVICGLSDINFLAKCKTCQKYYCNGMSINMYEKTSHIVSHINNKNHFDFIFPENSILDHDPKCKVCNEKNLKKLRFMWKGNPSEIQTISSVIICEKDECAENDDIQNEWELCDIFKIITEGKICAQLLKTQTNTQIMQNLAPDLEVKPLENNCLPKCELCGFEQGQFLAKCMDCGKYFCNQIIKKEGMEKCRSDIVKHAVDTQHVTYHFPHNGIQHANPQCAICGATNIFRLCYMKNSVKENSDMQEKSVIVCFEDCVHDEKIRENWSCCEPTNLIQKNHVWNQLLLVPTQKVLDEVKELAEIKIVDGNIEQYELNKELKRKQIDEIVKKDVPVQSFEEKVKMLEDQAKQSPQIPSKFNTTYKDVLSLDGRLYYAHKYESLIDKKIIEYDYKTKEITSKDPKYQKQLEQILQKTISYAQVFENAITLEFMRRKIDGEEQQKELEILKFYLRKRDNQTQELVVSWNRYDKISRTPLKQGNEIVILIIDEFGNDITSHGLVIETKDFLILRLSEEIPQNYLKLYKTQFQQDVIVESVLKDLQVFNGYTVWKFQKGRIILRQTDNDIAEKRMIHAIHQIEHGCIGTQLYKILLGKYEGDDIKTLIANLNIKLFPRNVDAEIQTLNNNLKILNLEFPNNAQDKAIRNALKNCITLIQGCPGGGKTFVASYIVSCFVSIYSKCKKPGKILCCAGSNIAADNIAIFCNKMKQNVIRVYAKALEDSTLDYMKAKEIQAISLSGIIENKLNSKQYISDGLISVAENDALLILIMGEEIYLASQLKEHIKITLEQAKSKLSIIEKHEMKSADVIICTCSTSGDARLLHMPFAAVLLDESSQVIEPEQMIAITHTSQQIVLIGDQKQLGPNINLQALRKAGLSRSLFQRLLGLRASVSSLDIQYRMHPGLLEFSNKEFYNNIITSGVNGNARMLLPRNQVVSQTGIQKLFKQDFPSIFINTVGVEQQEAASKSYQNQNESDMVTDVIKCLIREYKIEPEQIGVITPYSAQQTLLLKDLFQVQEGYQQIEISSVDGFQGREKEVIVFSAVRANTDCNIGFLDDCKRLNVTLTRAKCCLVIIANGDTLKKDIIWNKLWNMYQQKGTLYQGKHVSDLKRIERETNDEFDLVQLMDED